MLKDQKNKMDIGLKLWSNNDFYARQAQDLYKNGLIQYIEMFVVSGSIEFIDFWEKIPIPYVLHAPHSYTGLNFSIMSHTAENRSHMQVVELYAKRLKPIYVIYHPGIDGTIEEVISQINMFKREFEFSFTVGLVENKPSIALHGEHCIGSSPEEIQFIMEKTSLGFCFDFGHCFNYAATVHRDPCEIIRAFLQLKPKVFHLSDGKKESEKDMHLNFGKGDFDIPKIIRLIPTGTLLSVETEKKSKNNLDDFVADVFYLKRYFNEKHSN
jgi:deoxyribonuclease IV